MSRLLNVRQITIDLIRYHSKCDQLMTSQEVATALRPFFFVVHPDRFWNYPKEKDTNENSLKSLKSHIESLIERKQTNDTKITFYMRDENENHFNKSDHNFNQNLRQIHINLSNRENVNTTVRRILSQCRLSTEYLDRIANQSKVSDFQNQNLNNSSTEEQFRSNLNTFWINKNKYKQNETNFQDIEDIIQRKSDQNLIEWLKENNEKAKSRLKACKPIREELNRLSDQLKDELNLQALIWDCGWGVSHIRGCLKSLNTLKQQYSQDFKVLNGKTLVFGRQTGVSLDGYVILSIEDVRHNWLELIRNIHNYDSFLEKLPFAEGSLSGCLRGIEIDHRKFMPAVMVKRYIKQLEKLTTALVEFYKTNGYPKDWPLMLDNYQLVVECESGPLMVSPTGQFIVPASCPAFLLIDFISENMSKAKNLREIYLTNKSKEVHVINECLTALGLNSIDKDDNVTPDLMIECCQKLLNNKEITSRLLRSCHLRVSHYYSVLHDGEICIPWNFRF